jgi:CshA-type fibril repeat protein
MTTHRHRLRKTAWAAVPLTVVMLLGSAAAPALAEEATSPEQRDTTTATDVSLAATVSFTDPQLAACVNAQLGQAPTDSISDAQAASITSLSCADGGITNLDGISALSNLTWLYLIGHDLPDLGELGLVTTLQTLTIAVSNVSDLTPLSSLTSLTSLNLNGNRITDISPLAPLTQLTFLDLASNQVTDIAPLAGMTQMERLHLHFNRISDVTPLAGLSSLRYVLLLSNQIADVSPLSGIAAGLAGDEYIDARNQDIQLADAFVGTTQQTPVRGFDGAAVPSTYVFGPSTLAADGLSWAFDAAGFHAYEWTWNNPGIGSGSLTFSGTIAQQSVLDTTPTTLTDDTATTTAGTPVSIRPLDNDTLAGEPALDPSTLRLLDASGTPTDVVTTAQGEFTLVDGAVTFTPNAGFVGDVDPLGYQVSNLNGILSSATIRVTVTAVDSGETVVDPDTSTGGSATSPAGASLAMTGTEVPTDLVLVGLAALLLGASLIPLSRMLRRANARD